MESNSDMKESDDLSYDDELVVQLGFGTEDQKKFQFAIYKESYFHVIWKIQFFLNSEIELVYFSHVYG